MFVESKPHKVTFVTPELRDAVNKSRAIVEAWILEKMPNAKKIYIERECGGEGWINYLHEVVDDEHNAWRMNDDDLDIFSETEVGQHFDVWIDNASVAWACETFTIGERYD